MVRDAAKAVLKALLTEKDFLNELDGKVGDGDHGLNMARGAQSAIEALDVLDDDADLATILQAIGEAFTANVGGTAGRLYGAALSEAAAVVDDLTPPRWKKFSARSSTRFKLSATRRRAIKPCSTY